MPNIPEAAIAMLACARIGAIHSVVFGGFAAPELAVRIKDCTPKVIISASCGVDGSKIIDYKTLLDNAIALCASVHTVQHCIVYQRPQKTATLIPGRDLDWSVETHNPSLKLSAAKSTPVLSTDPLYILYTSGTTGAPKGVQRDNGGHAVALNWSMKHIYNISKNDVFWAARYDMF